MTEPGRPAQDNLTGVWNGLFRYSEGGLSISFTATLIDSGSLVTGSTHEPCAAPGCPRKTHVATLSGRRNGTAVSFVKAYDPPGYGYSEVAYEGTLNADGTEVAGSWHLRQGWSGDFLMIRTARRTAARTRKKVATV
jgi:hypothetical protein